MKKYSVFTVIAVFMTFFLAFCGEEKKEDPGSFQGIITFMKGNVKVNQKEAQIGLKVAKADTISVQNNSVAVVQFSTSAQITIESDTVITIDELLKNPEGKDSIAINQKSGATFSKIMPGKAEYDIHTPAVTAGVRGTSFRVMLDEGGKKAKIQLLRGKVAVKPKPEPGAKPDAAPVQEIILLSGNEIEATETKIAQPAALTEKEMNELSKLDQVAMIPEAKLKKIEAAKPEEVEAIIEQEVPDMMPEETEEMLVPIEIPEEKTEPKAQKEQVEEKPRAEVKKDEAPKMTIDDLKAKYKILSKVTTKSGQVYIGSFKQEGSQAEVITVDGPVTINAADIAKVEKY